MPWQKESKNPIEFQNKCLNDEANYIGAMQMEAI